MALKWHCDGEGMTAMPFTGPCSWQEFVTVEDYDAVVAERDNLHRGFNAAVATVEARDAELAAIKRTREQEADYANTCYQNQQLKAELAGYKESHDKYCPSAERVRTLEAQETAATAFILHVLEAIDIDVPKPCDVTISLETVWYQVLGHIEGLKGEVADKDIEISRLAAERDELRRRANTRTDALNEAEDRIRDLEAAQGHCSIHGECPQCRADRIIGDPREIVSLGPIVAETPEAMHARIVTETADAIAAQSETKGDAGG